MPKNYERHHPSRIAALALIRLRKPLSYYIEKYGSTYAMNKMYILMKSSITEVRMAQELQILKLIRNRVFVSSAGIVLSRPSR